MTRKKLNRPYDSFIHGKLALRQMVGITCPYVPIKGMFDHQEALVAWSLRRGRSAIFADTGLGKTLMELAWGDVVSDHTRMPVLMLTPLSVAHQSAEEADRFGIEARVCRDQSDVRSGINITNYDRLHLFDPRTFGGVILDESSCIKHQNAKTTQSILGAFEYTEFKLSATATPAPNDWVELGTQAQFLGICTVQEMLSEFFVHDAGDTGEWRLKGHAASLFWEWVASWASLIRSPADLGFDASAYKLPGLVMHEHLTDFELPPPPGQFFPNVATDLMQRRAARKGSFAERVQSCAAIVNSEPSEPWIVWCDLNVESEALVASIHGAVELRGSDTPDQKEEKLFKFRSGSIHRLVSKPSICGWGCNWQHVARQAFVGVTDSYEALYQAIRRSHRFGQQREVHVHLFASKAEGSVLRNLTRKENNSVTLSNELAKLTKSNVLGIGSASARYTNPYNATDVVSVPSFI